MYQIPWYIPLCSKQFINVQKLYYYILTTIKTLTITRLKCIIIRSIFVIFPRLGLKKEMISWCEFPSLVKKRLVYISSNMSKSVFCVLSVARLNSESLSTWDHSYITLAKRLGGWVGRRIL